jgi:hypothetical protein
VIGAQRIVIGGHQGAAYVFSESDGVWGQTDEFTESTGTSLDFFGGAVAFDGNTALIGIPGATVDDNQFQGAASFHTRSGGEPVIGATPASVTATQAVGTTNSQTLTIANSGEGELDWNIAEATDCSSPADLSWLSIAPASGSTAAAGSSGISMTFDSSGLAAGEYGGLLCIGSNDPVQAMLEIPVSLTVTPSTPDDGIFCSGFESGESGSCALATRRE